MTTMQEDVHLEGAAPVEVIVIVSEKKIRFSDFYRDGGILYIEECRL